MANDKVEIAITDLDGHVFITYKSNVVPRKFVPYLRVSHFDEKPGMCYTRDCGLCDYRTDEWIKAKCIELRDGRSVE